MRMADKINVVFINPPFCLSTNPRLSVSYPLGLMYIAAALEKKGVKVKIIDLINKRNMRSIISILKNNPADVFGISMLTHNRYEAFKIAKTIRLLYKDSKIVFGGAHPTILYEQLLRSIDVDAIFIGESELSFVDYILNLSEGRDVRAKIPGIAFRNNDGAICCTPGKYIEDIDEIPLPAFHLIDINRYKSRFNTVDFHLITSRGCPFHCNFCSLPAIHKGRYRAHSIARVIEELELIISFKKGNRILFHDDFFSVDSERTRNLCENIIKKGIAIRWSTRSRVDAVDSDTLRLMKKSGCEEIFYGVETGSLKILKNMNKKFEIEDVIKAFSLTKKGGIRAACGIMLGYPGENKETLSETKKLLSLIRPDKVYFTPTAILPGTTLYYDFMRQKLIDDSYWLKNKNSIPLYKMEMNYFSMMREIYDIHLSFKGNFIDKSMLIFNALRNEACFRISSLFDKFI